MCTFSPSERPKAVQARQFLTLLTWKCASCHNGVHFFDISTSKRGPNPSVSYTFDLEMCFAPQRRALFRHRNFQKWSENGVLCAFWLGNVLCATMLCTFSTSQRSKVFRRWCVLYILSWKCASCHNGVQFFISHLTSWLRIRCFSEVTFRPSGAPNHLKTRWIVTFLLFRTPASSCFSIFRFLDLLTSWLLLPDSSHLCFSISPYCRKFHF